MYDTICTIPLTSDLFTQATHPSKPLLAVGLAGGHVQTFRLPPVATAEGDSEAKNGFGTIETAWRTRRHKGSCRCVAWSTDGEGVVLPKILRATAFEDISSALFSTGTDSLLKTASPLTGQVLSKILLPTLPSLPQTHDTPTHLHALSPQTLLLAGDSSSLYLYDFRTPNYPSTRPTQTHEPHDDFVADLVPLPASGESKSEWSKQWVSVGGTTLAVTDLRKGVVARSEDQEEELVSGALVGRLQLGKGSGKKVGEKVVVGDAGGVLTLWERGEWEDQGERIVVDAGRGGGESLDSITVLPEGVRGGKCVAVGMGDGRVRFVDVGKRKVLSEVRHDDVESVLGLSIDVGGRLISGGGGVVKVWSETIEGEDEDEEVGINGGKGGAESESRDDGEEDEDSSEEEKKQRPKRKRQKRNKGKKDGGGHGVMAFKGMD
ncbi:MAG: WD repeat-containing protein jip5 [Candelina mexicana]|nr:MAG: WD repeat-containing protein jip5 [Candelina mexicana]